METIITSLFLFIAFVLNPTSASDNKTKVVFRFDDFRLKSTPFYDSLLIVFKKNEIPLCLGIVPFDNNGLFYNELNYEQLNDFRTRIKNNEIEIALHGYNHKDNELQKGSFFKKAVLSEFARLPYSSQYAKLKLAKESIDSLLAIDVNVFIPTFNTYDDNTLKVLESLKIEIISADINGSSKSKRMKYIPFTISNFNYLHKVIRKHQNDLTTIVVMLHSYSFKEVSNYTRDNSKRIDFKQLDYLLNWIRSQKHIEVTTFSLLSQNGIFDNQRLILNSLNNNLAAKILNKLKIYRYGVFVTREYEQKYQAIFVLINVFLHLVTFFFISHVTKLILIIIKPSKELILLLFAILILITYIILNKHRLIILAFFIVIILGAFIFGIIKGNKMLKNLE